MGVRLLLSIVAGALLLLSVAVRFAAPDQEDVAQLLAGGAALIVAVPALLAAWHSIRHPDLHGITDLLVALALLAAWLEGDLVTAALLPLVMTIGHILEERSLVGSAEAIRALTRLTRAKARRVGPDGAVEEVWSTALRVGDVVELRAGDRVPADGIVREGRSSLDTSTEQAVELFERYIKALIRRYPTLNRPTRLDFGPARVIVLDLEAVAPTGSAEADRQTDLMYLLGRHILARNFFLRPKYVAHVPELVRAHHARRFAEIYEATKRLDYDEYHRTKGRRFVRAQVELDRREGRKHNTQLSLSSQRIEDFGDDLVSQSTGRFILGAGDETEAEEIIARFRLTEAAAEVIRHRLKGPFEDGSGSPFLAVVTADNVTFEQMLVNSLGPIELWAFSTTPSDVSLRNRLYERVGFTEGLRRLALVFPAGTAKAEVEERKNARLRRGEEGGRAQAGVVEELADELVDGRGLGIGLRRREAAGAVDPETVV